MAFWDRWTKKKEIPPVDRTQIMLSGGGAVPHDHSHIKLDQNTGQQKAYVVLTPEERDKGFVRPVRREYIHSTCGGTTKMALDLSETYARDPSFYTGTFCCHCGLHLPLREFFWKGTNERVGS